ncbi:MAG: flippase-like domain-containing protein [Deltaproteobacteria bacterium]|nr:flippase-like domain-containing protein [Deltaproteobacteria bacterium]
MKLRYLFLCFGAILLFFLIHRLGLDTILTQFAQLGWWVIPIFGLSALWYLCYTVAWQRILQQKRPLALHSLYRIKIVGEVINAMTPANFLGGDPVRVYLLRRFFPGLQGAASVIIDRTLQSLATLGIILIGLLVAYWRIPQLPQNIRYGLPLIVLILSAFVVWIFLHQRHGLCQFGFDMLKGLRIRRHFSPDTLSRAAELDQLIASFYRHDPQGFAWALLYHLCGRVLGIVEVYWIGRLLVPEFGLVEAVILAALAPIINLLFTFVPGAIGIMEGAYSTALFLLALPPPLGLTIQIFKRVRAGLWIVIGSLFVTTRDRQELFRPTMKETGVT